MAQAILGLDYHTRRIMPRKPTGQPSGRPSKFDPDLAAAVLSAIEAGATEHAACNAVGAPVSSYRRWVRQDREGLKRRHAGAERLRDSGFWCGPPICTVTPLRDDPEGSCL